MSRFILFWLRISTNPNFKYLLDETQASPCVFGANKHRELIIIKIVAA